MNCTRSLSDVVTHNCYLIYPLTQLLSVSLAHPLIAPFSLQFITRIQSKYQQLTALLAQVHTSNRTDTENNDSNNSNCSNSNNSNCSNINNNSPNTESEEEANVTAAISSVCRQDAQGCVDKQVLLVMVRQQRNETNTNDTFDVRNFFAKFDLKELLKWVEMEKGITTVTKATGTTVTPLTGACLYCPTHVSKEV